MKTTHKTCLFKSKPLTVDTSDLISTNCLSKVNSELRPSLLISTLTHSKSSFNSLTVVFTSSIRSSILFSCLPNRNGSIYL